jgi:hypothetical protein
MADETLADCQYEGAVYVFSGENAETSDLNANNEEGNPLMIVPVELDGESSLYAYKAAFLPEGNYTISYSCQDDNNEQDDDLDFEGTQSLEVVANQTIEAKLIPLVE